MTQTNTPAQCALITLDYKLNFTPEKSDQIPDLHERVAQRVGEGPCFGSGVDVQRN